MRTIIAIALLAGTMPPSPFRRSQRRTAGRRAPRATLTGRAAVPKGARHGRAHASLRLTGRNVRWSISGVRSIGRPRAAWVYKAIPVTARLGIAQAIACSPEGFYLSIATRRFPLGAVHGQVRRA